MVVVLFVGALLVAVVAAVRGTWSPCGWSMYSTLTPLAEQGRGHPRWAPTVGWFIGGAALGGTVLGSLGALGAALIRPGDLPESATLGLASAAFVVAFAFDAGLLRPALPHHRRQVDERWLDRYRRWVYAGGFGVQIGSGLATYIMTAGVYLVVVVGALTARPWLAFATGVVFGATRGSALLLAARLDRPERLRAFHHRFARMERPVTAAVAGCWALAAVLSAGAAGDRTVVVAITAVALVASVAVLAQRGVRRPAQGQAAPSTTQARSTRP